MDNHGQGPSGEHVLRDRRRVERPAHTPEADNDARKRRARDIPEDTGDPGEAPHAREERRSSPFIKNSGVDDAGFWNRLKAEWYHRGLKYNTLPNIALNHILPKAKGAKTFLDIGSGCGTLAIPLAKAGRSVTALDSSKAMIDLLKEDITKLKIKGIKPVLAPWGAVKVKPHDAILCANVPTLLSEPEGFLREIDGLAKKAVFIIESADPDSDKFYYKELYPLLFNKSFGKELIISHLPALHSLGIYANVEIIDYDFDQPFGNIEEAIEFWKEYIGIVTEEHDRKLRAFLGKNS
jgi:SAM-dependent methyltransferase